MEPHLVPLSCAHTCLAAAGCLAGRTAACFWGCPCCHCGPGHQWAPIGLPGWPEGAVCAHPGGLGMQRTIEGVCGSLSSGEECAHGSCGWACTADELIRACSAAAGRKMTPVSMAHWPRSTKGALSPANCAAPGCPAVPNLASSVGQLRGDSIFYSEGLQGARGLLQKGSCSFPGDSLLQTSGDSLCPRDAQVATSRMSLALGFCLTG